MVSWVKNANSRRIHCVITVRIDLSKDGSHRSHGKDGWGGVENFFGHLGSYLTKKIIAKCFSGVDHMKGQG